MFFVPQREYVVYMETSQGARTQTALRHADEEEQQAADLKPLPTTHTLLTATVVFFGGLEYTCEWSALPSRRQPIVPR